MNPATPCQAIQKAVLDVMLVMNEFSLNGYNIPKFTR